MQADDGSTIVNTGPPRSSHTQEGYQQGGRFSGPGLERHSSHLICNSIIWSNLTPRRLGNVGSCEPRKEERGCHGLSGLCQTKLSQILSFPPLLVISVSCCLASNRKLTFSLSYTKTHTYTCILYQALMGLAHVTDHLEVETEWCYKYLLGRVEKLHYPKALLCPTLLVWKWGWTPSPVLAFSTFLAFSPASSSSSTSFLTLPFKKSQTQIKPYWVLSYPAS